jgi:hypothetical protein
MTYDSTKLRGYFFGNMYLSQIQQGIQCAHVVTKMFNKYTFDSSPAGLLLSHWARDGVTKILLNGGYQQNLQYIFNTFYNLGSYLALPFEKFREEREALNEALTSVGIIVPEEIYNYKLDTEDLLGLYKLLVRPEAHAEVVYWNADSIRAATRELEEVTSDAEKIMALSDGIVAGDITSDHLEAMKYLLHRTLKSCRLA